LILSQQLSISNNEFETIYDKRSLVVINHDETPISDKEKYANFIDAKEYLISGTIPVVKSQIISKKKQGKSTSFSFWSIFDCFRQTKKKTKKISRSASNIILSPQNKARIMNYSQKL